MACPHSPASEHLASIRTVFRSSTLSVLAVLRSRCWMYAFYVLPSVSTVYPSLSVGDIMPRLVMLIPIMSPTMLLTIFVIDDRSLQKDNDSIRHPGPVSSVNIYLERHGSYHLLYPAHYP